MKIQVPQCDNRCNTFFISRQVLFRWKCLRDIHESSDCTILEITGIQDKIIAAETHDTNYANYMQILSDATVDC